MREAHAGHCVRRLVLVPSASVTDANAGQALDGPAIFEEEHEVVLHEEVPVVEKQAVPKERVRLQKDTITDEAQVSDEVRKERIEADGDHR
jgi:stress response protein YsnF